MPAARVLVILPTLGDRLETLAETLETVETQRSDISVTLVVIVPPEAADARSLAERHGALIVDDPRRGISTAINAGLAARAGEEFYAWIGDDDLFRAGGLAALARKLDDDPGAVLAFGACEYIDPDGRTIAVSAAGPAARPLLPWGPDLIPHPGTMVRLDALEAVGGFAPELRYAMDLDAFLRLRSHGRFAWTRTVVSAFRWHPDSLTVANRRASSDESERVKRAHLPPALRAVSPLWALPVRWASRLAAGQVSRRARRGRPSVGAEIE